ncbi:hypothetical protein B0T18DRAFT_341693 [Schizothecium vesticola]|uniref:Acetoacetate decarboxylase n=1 Tax=Schizothecium vesticola TaxID=314040 RepID=A0AA40F5W9_9PEZI|nr:hypothetical protein B0T18DRAFT_341693 [Schizothecium vesticola]
MPPSPNPILPVPPPWDLKCTIFIIPFYTTASTARQLPAKAFHPLEAASPFASPAFGVPVGGLSMMQLIRYTDTPVGPYDELILAPGYFEYPLEDAKGGKKATGKNLRITRIYVSQERTAWNGRTNWNIPKHLARFEWNDLPDGSTTIKVFPHDVGVPYSPAEAEPAAGRPWFQCTIRPVGYLPAFPMSTEVMKWVGIDAALVQPPLPQGEGSKGELVGTERWCKLEGFRESSRRSRAVWVDMDQGEEGGREEGGRFFFPGLRKWNLAVKMEEGDVFFPEGKYWETPKGAV